MDNQMAIQSSQNFLISMEKFIDPKLRESLQRTINLAHFANRLVKDLQEIQEHRGV